MSFSGNNQVSIDDFVSDLFTNPEDHPEDFVNGEYVGQFPEEHARVAHLYTNKSIRYFEDQNAFAKYCNQIMAERGIKSHDNLFEGNHEGRKTLIFRISPTEEAVLVYPENVKSLSIDELQSKPEPEPEPEEEEELFELPLEPREAPRTPGFDGWDVEEISQSTPATNTVQNEAPVDVPGWSDDSDIPVLDEDESSDESSEEITADTPVLAEEVPGWDSDESDDSEESDEPVIVQQLNHVPTTAETRSIRTYAGRKIPESYIREILENMPRGNFNLKDYPLDTDYGCIIHALHYIDLFTTGFYQLSLDERTLVVEIYLHELQNIHEDPRLQEHCTCYARVSLRLSEEDNTAIRTHSRKKVALRSYHTTRDLIYRTFESIYMLPIRNMIADIDVPGDGIFKCSARNVAKDAGISAGHVEDFNRTGTFEDAIQVMCPTSEEISYLYRVLGGDNSKMKNDEIVMFYNMMQQHLEFEHSLLIDKSVRDFIHSYNIKFSVRTTGAIQ